MAKGYWISVYHSISDPAGLAEYAKIAGPVITAAGGKFLARGMADRAYEAGVKERTVVVEFDSLEKAIATYESAEYKKAIDIVVKAAKRDVRLIAGA